MKTPATFLLLSALAADALAGTVAGSAAYRERAALPPGAVFEATLEDVSRADAPAEVLGRTRLEPPGNPPIPFEIAYEDGKIRPGHRYAVRARILLKDRLLFSGARPYPASTQGQGGRVDLLLRRAPSPKQPQAGGLGPLPASFEGELPCADCPGVRYHLDLFPDRIYYLRMDYLERDLALDSVGNWTLSGDGRLLSLSQSRETVDRYAVKDAATLRKLDPEGREIATALNYDLKRAAAFQPMEPRLSLRGLYSRTADAGLFIECGSRLRLPVAAVGDNAELEAAYAKARQTPGERIVAEVEGRVAARPGTEGAGEQPTLVVERFASLGQPGETCGGPEPQAELLETFWEMTHLGEESLKLRESRHPPHLVLHSQDQRLAGFDGCNKLLGSYALEGEKLAFGRTASTRMACPAGMDAAQAFHRALEQVKTWKIDGERLELFDGAGKSLARFEARYLR